MSNRSGPIPILLFADSILGIPPYDWQCKILLNYEAGFPTAAACANFTGKTSIWRWKLRRKLPRVSPQYTKRTLSIATSSFWCPPGSRISARARGSRHSRR